MLDLCAKEVPSVTFLGVGQEEMVNVRADLEDRVTRLKTVPGKRSSHHFVSIYCNKIAYKFKNEDSFFNLISTNP